MQTHQLKREHGLRGKKRVGRGGKKGTYSGRGIKGQSQRSGRKMMPMIRELIKRYPKLRGYKTIDTSNYFAVINLDILEKKFEDGDIINSENLIKKGIVGKINGKAPAIKILGSGKITKKLIIQNCAVSKKAKEAIEKANGSIK